MGIPDSFDPLMFLSKTDDTVAGDYAAPTDSAKGRDDEIPVLGYAGDGTAQIRSAANTKHNSAIQGRSGERSVYPSRVDQFDPINLTRGLQHPDVEAEEKNPAGAGG